MNSKRNKRSVAYTIIQIILGICALLCIIPFLHIIACSFASPRLMASSKFLLFPTEVSLSAMEYIIKTPSFGRAMWNSLWTTTVATLFSMIVTTLLAYPLSHRDLKGRKFIMLCLVFTMIFNPGMIPGYLNVKRLNLLDTWWALLIPQMVSTYNLILVKNYFESLPIELREAAKIDGANDLKICYKIMIPLAKPVLAAVTLFYAVANWNSYFTAILFINDDKKWPIQLVLRNIVLTSQMDLGSSSGSVMISSVNLQSLKYAVILVSTIPILIVYPFAQKHFTKGLMLGSVKG